MEEEVIRSLVGVCHRLHARGWVANHDGNVSARLEGKAAYVASPTAVSKAAVGPEMVVRLDADGKVSSGTRKVFSEISLHLACFAARPDIRWVVHAHPPTATGFAVAGMCPFDPPFLAEAVVSLGARIPLVPFTAPGANQAALTEAIAGCDAVLLENHGVLVVGPDAETAFLRMELVEHLARIALVARQLGGPRPLPESVLVELLAARQRAGLGPGSTSVPSAGAASPGQATPSASADADSVVREALRRFS